ncbi:MULTISPECIES: SH3 domain-containing protein [unclassified Streptomyces]|uniref:SH3 domain-containing protein n=1 Tax=unclassified Streptomyces TaxID=2593676 RepID=UPI0037FCDC2F
MSTTDIFGGRGKQLAAGAGALTAALTLGATLLAAAPAQAAPPAPPSPPQGAAAKPYGTITASHGLTLRQDPSTDALVRGYIRHQVRIGLQCKVRAQSIEGNNIWYLVRDTRDSWISAKHVNNSGAVKFCKDMPHNKVAPNNPPKHAKG